VLTAEPLLVRTKECLTLILSSTGPVHGDADVVQAGSDALPHTVFTSPIHVAVA
jgi:hypothetical protein